MNFVNLICNHFLSFSLSFSFCIFIFLSNMIYSGPLTISKQKKLSFLWNLVRASLPFQRRNETLKNFSASSTVSVLTSGLPLPPSLPSSLSLSYTHSLSLNVLWVDGVSSTLSLSFISFDKAKQTKQSKTILQSLTRSVELTEWPKCR